MENCVDLICKSNALQHWIHYRLIITYLVIDTCRKSDVRSYFHINQQLHEYHDSACSWNSTPAPHADYQWCVLRIILVKDLWSYPKPSKFSRIFNYVCLCLLTPYDCQYSLRVSLSNSQTHVLGLGMIQTFSYNCIIVRGGFLKLSFLLYLE